LKSRVPPVAAAVVAAAGGDGVAIVVGAGVELPPSVTSIAEFSTPLTVFRFGLSGSRIQSVPLTKNL
jgi:hypothetical protein